MISVPDTNPLVAAIALAITDARVSLKGSPSPPAFNPDSLFGGGDGGGVIDIGRLNTLFQDDAGTVPVTATGQVVRSIRARNRPTFLMVLDPAHLEATYELDPQGFPALKAAESASFSWAYYLKGDGGLPVTDYSIVMSTLGTYGSGVNIGVGTGWSLFGDSDGSYGEPYDYAGVYTVQPSADSAELRSTLDGGFETFPVIENIDDRPYVYSTRSNGGDVDYQINLEPRHDTPNGAPLFPAPVGIKFWISPGDYWYGGVFITRYLSDQENLDTQKWCGNLAGITLAPIEPFYPTDLFLPGDHGGLFSANDISTLFQARTGPTNPVTANGQTIGWVENQKDGDPPLSRPLFTQPPVFNDPLFQVNTGTATTNGWTGVADGVYDQMTIVTAFTTEPAGGGPLSARFFTTRITLNEAGGSARGGGIELQTNVDTSVRARLSVTGQNIDTTIPNAVGEPVVCAGRFDANSPTQYLSVNDVELTPTATFVPIIPNEPNSLWYTMEAPLPPNNPFTVLSGGMFYINRWLSDTELDQLKTWMRANTPTP